MASQSHTKKVGKSADGTMRAYEWGDNAFPFERVRALSDAVETCTPFGEADLSINSRGPKLLNIILTTHKRIIGPELMRVLAEFDAVIELERDVAFNEKSWRVALPIED